MLATIAVVAAAATVTSLLIAAFLYGKPEHEKVEIFWSVTAALLALMWLIVIGAMIAAAQPEGL